MAIDVRAADGAATRTVERALALLSEVCAHDELTLTEAARATGLPASTALRLLRTLEATGFVERDDAGWYYPGARILQIGASALGRNALVRLAEPTLDRIVAATGESVYLSVRGPHDTAVYLVMAEGTHSVRHTSWAGRTVPLDGLAVGRALRGEVPPGGFVTQRDRLEPDVTAICAPIRRLGGVVGAISILGPTYRLDDDRIARYGAILSRETTDLGALLGVPHHTGQEIGS